jgi:hypothetical protein
MGSRLLLNVREVYYGSDVVLSQPLSTIRWRQRNSDCVMMDSLPEHTRDSSLTVPGFEIERLQGISQPDPSSSADTSAQVKTPSKVTFNTPRLD